ncbi:MAG: hypothetical protein ACLVBP_16545 [Ruminococcus sp.]
MGHTHASLLLEQGISIDTISRRLGHENSDVTREIYLHVTKSYRKKIISRLPKYQFYSLPPICPWTSFRNFKIPKALIKSSVLLCCMDKCKVPLPALFHISYVI